jgi:2-keto-3-deoxy-L-rhamnonate aldolase RhmA
MLDNPLAATLKAGRLGLAMIVKQARSPDIALAAKTCGYDAVYVDLEHSVIPESDAAAICLTALNVGITPLVRVPSHEAHYANRILNAGALGIVAPHVETAEEARHIVDACRFAPLGTRSVANSWPHFAYAAMPAGEVRAVLNANTTVVVMLETPAAVARAAEIAAVPGVDILHIGSSDLCDALGIPGQFGHPELEKAYRKVIDACRAHGKVAGVGGMGGAPEVAKKIIGMGVRFITAGNEWAFMMQAARQRAAMLRELPLQ